MGLTKTEGYSALHEVMSEISAWSRPHDCPMGRAVGGRFFVVIVTPIFSIMDVCLHTILALGKTLTGIIVTPYNAIVLCIATEHPEEYRAPSDLELTSALIHLLVVVKSVLFIPVIMISGLFSPELAARNADPASVFLVSEPPVVIDPMVYGYV